MRTLRERLYVDCPFGKAPSFLNDYLNELARRVNGEQATLRLIVPLEALGLPTGLSLRRDVVAHFSPPQDAYGVQKTAVTWKPEGGGPFPTFTGALSVEQDERYGTSSLYLEDTYDPPLGAIGKGFDAALGRHIAAATARELLGALKRRIEQDWSATAKIGG